MIAQDPAVLRVLEAANRAFFDQIKSADQKAAYVITVALALTITSEVAREAFKITTYAGRSSISAVAAFSHVSLIIITLIFSLLVVFPRFKNEGGSLYWGAWPEAGRRLAVHTLESPIDEQNEYIESNTILASICRKKFTNLRISFVLLILACLTHAVLLAVQ